MDNTRLLQTCYDGTPMDKLARARALLAGLPAMEHDPCLQAELQQLRRHAELLDEQMRAMHLGPLCSGCAAQPGGGCCSAFMAGNSDALQLLINLLLDVPLAFDAYSGDSCGFLGPRGCRFLIKPIFCLNYNCSHILNSADPADLTLLYQRSGAVLSCQTRIETSLIERLRRLPHGSPAPF
ncbi:hypothetical protein Despr_0904 [Desulfobulbus propionicus DSM 2032]|uniref:Uncharacterized protein n=1 Tax=Desulfobulbus propionicus (strain ATCC 33891 / DSM 2032 / VKM B-1956 / 1pr3) TaxID=577650 RepID=A0A7U3YKR8_DESPD|nr:hypothetical protein [Desulfobulbus propionicus]ADW17078.1 hypothetical protein Despr_0904 [Desulfobulbus propionicus DSM 2032]